jgi:hexosaminidase
MGKLILIILIIFCWEVSAQCPIIPAPSVYQEMQGGINISDEISIDPKDLPEEVKEYLTKQLNNLFNLRVVYSTAGRHFAFKRLINVPKDHYTINVNEKITISYSSDASAFYAVNSMIQMMEEQDGGYYVKKSFVSDQPKFEWRGLHLDVSRHFFSVEEVKRYIDLMAYYKFNIFHWHLTDDQGWRIEIKKYPKLTEIGAWRDSTVNKHYNTIPRTYTKERYGGFYSQDEIREVVKYAQKKFITIVPEIEMPGHARAALAAYAEYSCTGKQNGVEGLWGVFDDIYCSKAESIQFQKDILDEVLQLFPSEYIHIGGDEAPKTRWKECVNCQKVIKENGLKDEHELQSYFIRKIDAYLKSKGRKLIGWDEILEGGLSPNATVMSWRGFEGGMEAASQGHYVVMSPGSHCYFDHYQSKHPLEPLAIGGFTPLEKVYNFSPIANGMSADEAAYVLGGQANVWTEYIPDFKQVEYMVYPRALALSQALWSQNKPEYNSFKEILKNDHLPFLRKLGVNYSEALFYPEMKIKRTNDGVVYSITAEENKNLAIEIHEADGTVSNLGNEIFSNRTLNGEVNCKSIHVKSDQLSEDTEFKFVQHPSIGVGIEYITKPSDKYNSGGDLTLCDGIIGAKPWRGNEWVGFQQQEINFIIDMGEKKHIEEIEINFLEDHGSWIHVPASVRYSISKDKKKWKFLSGATILTYEENIKKGKHLLFSSLLNKKGRYINVLITTFDVIPEGLPGANNVAWTFMDELIIFTR